MGRKKVSPDMERRSLSISMPRHLIARLDLLTSHRSRWIERAVMNRIEAAGEAAAMDDRQLLAILHARTKEDVEMNSLVNLLREKLLLD